MRSRFIVASIAIWISDSVTASGQYKPAVHWEGPLLKLTVVEKLTEPVLPKDEWKRAGFSTPQQTLETFMWAIREQDIETYEACVSAPDKLPIESWKKLRNDVYAVQCLAIMTTGEDDVVDLKFRCAISAQGRTMLAHRFQRIDGAWKLDLSSSTYVPDW